ncbi:MAG: TRAP transporter small permease [Tissierellaceae bacterium]|jgi:TRAP-type C4-dicarboxylate transport system permease small subunit
MRKINKRLTDIMEGFAMVFITLMLLIVVLQVFSRLIISKSPRWTEEVAAILMTWFAFIGMAIGIGEGIHISIAFFLNLLPKSLRKGVTVLGELLIIYFGGSLLYYGSRLVYHTRTSTLPATQWPAFMPYIMAPIAGFLVIMYTIEKIIETMKDDDKIDIDDIIQEMGD